MIQQLDVVGEEAACSLAGGHARSSYHASRAEPLTGVETAGIQRIVAAHAAFFPSADEEQLFLYSTEQKGSTRTRSSPDPQNCHSIPTGCFR
ncbi:hypothetical protein [Streptomyces shenzhenensis]|uniref:hypothetical protein n=1 Tax=Streptomyces shenzhenensis TaxID=943815 RepID=UPI0015F0A5AD|nr:hypothetical protein [Streptomyces shenzhenensis]